MEPEGCVLTSALSHKAMASGALRDPGARTASRRPHRTSSSTSVTAKAVEGFTGSGLATSGRPGRDGLTEELRRLRDPRPPRRGI